MENLTPITPIDVAREQLKAEQATLHVEPVESSSAVPPSKEITSEKIVYRQPRVEDKIRRSFGRPSGLQKKLKSSPQQYKI